METILFVDDEKPICDLMARSFASESYEILTAVSGREALEILKDKSVDIVVSDQEMREMSGLELFQVIKEQYPSVIRILISGQPSLRPEDISTLVKAVHQKQIFRFLAKTPDFLEVIKTTIQEALEVREQLAGIDSGCCS